MARVKHRVGIYGGIGQVFLALKASEGFAGLWVSSAEVNAKIDGKADLMLESLTGLKFKYKDIQENERAAIQCVEGPGRWTGSEILFELENADDQVFVSGTRPRRVGLDIIQEGAFTAELTAIDWTWLEDRLPSLDVPKIWLGKDLDDPTIISRTINAEELDQFVGEIKLTTQKFHRG